MKIKFLSITLFFVVTVAFYGCESDWDGEEELSKSVESEIINSTDFEDVVIASNSLQFSLEKLSIECNKKDLDPETRKRVFLALWSEEKMESKLQTFNDKKKAFRDKWPVFFTLNEKQKNFCLKTCNDRSLRVNTALLRLGFSPFQTRTDGGKITETFSSKQSALNHASEWVKDSNYVEAAIFVHENGKYTFLVTDKNTVSKAEFPLGTSSLGIHVTQGENKESPITEVWHTHRNTSDCSTGDSLAAEKYPSLNWGIVYNDSVHYFHYAK